MKKLVLATALIISQLIFSQVTRFIYQVSQSPDSTKLDDKKIESAYLDVDGQKSIFYSENILKRDSIIERMRTTKSFDRTKLQESRSNINYVIEKDIANQSLLYKDRIGREQYSYNEKPNFSWKILPETIKIGDYNTQKAETQYGGRTWYAWFTQDVPLQDGPYKFSGLPGLIVKLEDSKGQYSFDLMQTKKITDLQKLQSRGYYINLTKEKYIELNKKYRKDPSSFINVTAGPVSGGPRASFKLDPIQIQEMKKRLEAEIKSQNNPIELYK